MKHVLLVLLAGCSSAAVAPPADLAVAPDLVVVDKSLRCTGVFGNALTNAFGRLDGTVLAIVPPGDNACPFPNNDHLILEVRSGGAAYRMVVNVQSDIGTDRRVLMTTKQSALAGPAWADGWHPSVQLDYPTTLGVHKAQFTPLAIDALTAAITGPLQLDAPVSVYATSSGGDSAHLVHRNTTNLDGAIVVDPQSASPTYLLFAFAEQSF